jgi:hypothetical protein
MWESCGNSLGGTLVLLLLVRYYSSTVDRPCIHPSIHPSTTRWNRENKILNRLLYNVPSNNSRQKLRRKTLAARGGRLIKICIEAENLFLRGTLDIIYSSILLCRDQLPFHYSEMQTHTQQQQDIGIRGVLVCSVIQVS